MKGNVSHLVIKFSSWKRRLILFLWSPHLMREFVEPIKLQALKNIKMN